LCGGANETLEGREHFRLVEQEGVVALVGLDLDEAHIGGRRVQRMDDLAVSDGGKSQSLEKATTQKRVLVPLKALASTPP